MSRGVRKMTVKLLEAMDEEAIEPRVVAEMCLHYMSEADVEDMCRTNDVFQEEQDEEQG